MVKITSKLYTPKNLLEVINAVEKCLIKSSQSKIKSSASDIVIDLRKMGYKIVKVDDGTS